MEILGYIGAIFIGLVLGLIGGGGSILTVPILVYLFRVEATVAVVYSMLVVGVVSSLGVVSNLKRRLVDVKIAFIFGIPSIASVFVTRKFVVPKIPEVVFNIGGFTITKNMFLMVFFAVVMLFASYKMIKKTSIQISEKVDANLPVIMLQGGFIGLITGLVGAGGGFLIIPALVNFLKMDIKKAIATSLLIILMNSLFGFLCSMGAVVIQWSLISKVIILAMIGIVIGSYLSSKIDGKKLKPAFGCFVLLMAIYIFIKEVFI